MSDDIFSSFGRGFVAFAHTRAANLVGDSFSDSGKLIVSLADGKTGTTKTAFDAVKDDVKNLTDIGKALKEAIDKEITDGKSAVQEMASELGHDPFGAGETMRALTALGKLLVAYDNAIGKIAEKVSQKASGSMSPAQVKADINGMNAPIKKLLNNAGGAVTANFDKLCQFVLSVDGASDKLGDKLVWNYDQKRLQVEFASARPASPSSSLTFDGGSLVAFFTYQSDVKAGIEVKTKLKAGLRGDKLLEKIIPGQATTADADQVAITLDTHDGLTFGSGKDKRLVLPVRFSCPGVELRELGVEQPAQDNVENKNRVNVTVTVAGKLGDVFAAVVEGGGVSIRWVDGGDPDVKAKIPSGAGLRLKTGIVTGGGYLRFDEVKEEYGGVFQLEFVKIGVTAIGLLGTKRFSLVIVIGVHFAPKIELGFGFTLSGLGGILAIERSLDSAALRDGLKDGVVGQLLFPADPVAAAPQILIQLGNIFPQRDGGFVIGPIAELGWGSQAGFVKARLGIVLSLPDPKIVLLGALEIGVPSADVDEKLRVVDLRAELMGEITPDYFFLKVSLAKSKLFKIEITGDLALFIQWAGEGAFALSVGGFFPGFEAPKQIGDMQRVGMKFAPPVDWLSISAVAYVAITANTVQFGGRVELFAKVSPAKAEAWLQLDALFKWAPHFYFIVRIDAGIKVSVFGETLAGVTFRGELSGDQPFRLEGHAEVEVLWWDVPVDVGPIEWGEPTPAPAPQIDPLQVAATALRAEAAWTPLLPPEAQSIARLAPADDARLYHPLGQIELRQISIPLETDIDRIGSSKVTRKRINVRSPRLNGAAAGAVWPLVDHFPPGHFLELSDQQVLGRPEYEDHASGCGLGASRGASFSDATHAGYAWNTVCPNENFDGLTAHWLLGAKAGAGKMLAAAAKARQLKTNPYLPVGPRPSEEILTPRGNVRVVSAETLILSSPEAAMPASVAARIVEIGAQAGVSLTTLSAGLM
jgi:hypothetical protein